MDALIIGGLLVVGVGAIVALFFVLRDDGTPKTTQDASQQTDETLKQGVPVATQQPNNTLDSETVMNTVPSMEASPRSALEQEQPLRVHLNGQFHELAHGLRTLQQQATEMEQRLGSLNQLIDNIENDQGGER